MSKGLPLTIGKTFKKRLLKKPAEMQAAVWECLQKLTTDTRSGGLETHKVKGTRDVFEAKIDRGNRVTFRYRTKAEGGGIELLNHCNHSIIDRHR